MTLIKATLSLQCVIAAFFQAEKLSVCLLTCAYIDSLSSPHFHYGEDTSRFSSILRPHTAAVKRSREHGGARHRSGDGEVGSGGGSGAGEASGGGGRMASEKSQHGRLGGGDTAGGGEAASMGRPSGERLGGAGCFGGGLGAGDRVDEGGEGGDEVEDEGEDKGQSGSLGGEDREEGESIAAALRTLDGEEEE